MFPPVIKCENISFKSVKISFIYDKVCFIIFSTRYHALPYALPYYNSTHDLFLCNIRCITVHVTLHFERNKYIFVPFSMGYHALPSVLRVIVYFFFKNLMVTHGNALKMEQIFTCSIQNVW